MLAAFTEGQITRFIDRWYTHIGALQAMSVENARGRAQLLKCAIFGNNRLYSLAERPLLLTLMASLHAARGGSLPEKREELYNDAVELLLDWWENPKIVTDAKGQRIVLQESLKELLNVGKETVREILAMLAFQAHASQAGLVDAADISESVLLTKLLESSANPNLRPIQLLKYLSDRAGLLIPRGVKVYTFPHRTFQEYLAACHLTGEDEYPSGTGTLAGGGVVSGRQGRAGRALDDLGLN